MAIVRSNRHQGEERDESVIQRPDPQTAAEQKPIDPNGAARGQLAPQLPANQVAAEDEKQIDPNHAILERRQPREPTRFAAACQIGFAKVEQHHHQHRGSAQEVERANLPQTRPPQIAHGIDDEDTRRARQERKHKELGAKHSGRMNCDSTVVTRSSPFAVEKLALQLFNNRPSDRLNCLLRSFRMASFDSRTAGSKPARIRGDRYSSGLPFPPEL